MTKEQNSAKMWKYLSMGLMLVVTLIGFVTVKDYGYSWDETFRFKGGDAKLQYYGDLVSGEPRKAHTSSYPGLFDLPLAAFHEALPEFGTRSQKGHVWSLCFGLLGLFSVWRLSAMIGGERAGFWALLFLATFPRYYGHMFFNPKDIPLAGTYAFGCWALVAFFSSLPNVRWKHVLWIGCAAGLAMSCRIAGFLILVYFGLFVGLYLCSRYALKRVDLAELPKDLIHWATRGAIAGLVGLAILFVFWPTIHVNPFENIGSSVEKAQSFGWSGMVLMDGYFWEAQDLPFYYLPYWFMRTWPEQILILVTLAMMLAVVRLFKILRQKDGDAVLRLLPSAVLFFSGLFPIAYILWKDPVMYDGLRHVLFALPPLIATAALAFEWLLRFLERRSGIGASKVAQAIALLSVAVVVLNLIRIHPYQYVYFNTISGGLPGAFNRDETDYWGISHQEAGEWLNQYVETIDPGGERVYNVHQRYSRWMLKEALNPERFEMRQPREGADFFVSVTRFNMHKSYPDAELLHVVQRQGVPLCFVYSFVRDEGGAE